MTHRTRSALVALGAVALAAACSGGTSVMVGGGGGGDDADEPVAPTRLDAGIKRDGPMADGPRSDTPVVTLPPPTAPVVPWQAKDVGVVAAKGELRVTGSSVYLIRAGGADVGGAADAFYFLHQTVRGDFEIITRVRSLQRVHAETKAGLMVRASDAPDAANAFLAVLGEAPRGGLLQSRPSAGAMTQVVATDQGVRAGQWLRLTRQGRTITAQRSSNRTTWVRVGSVDLDLPADVLVGYAATARHASMLGSSEVDALRLHNLDSQPATRDWSFEELVAMGGSAVHAGGALTVSGLGEPFTLLQEFGVFAFRAVEGNKRLTVKVTKLDHTDPNARVGLMIREGPPVTFGRTQPAVVLGVTGGAGVQFQSRDRNNLMATMLPPAEGLNPPVWLRLERTTDSMSSALGRFTGSYSQDGVQWTALGSVAFSLPEPYLMGILVHANGSDIPAVATMTDVALVDAPDAPPPPPVDAGAPPADAQSVVDTRPRDATTADRR